MKIRLFCGLMVGVSSMNQTCNWSGSGSASSTPVGITCMFRLAKLAELLVIPVSVMVPVVTPRKVTVIL